LGENWAFLRENRAVLSEDRALMREHLALLSEHRALSGTHSALLREYRALFREHTCPEAQTQSKAIDFDTLALTHPNMYGNRDFLREHMTQPRALLKGHLGSFEREWFFLREHTCPDAHPQSKAIDFVTAVTSSFGTCGFE